MGQKTDRAVIQHLAEAGVDEVRFETLVRRAFELEVRWKALSATSQAAYERAYERMTGRCETPNQATNKKTFYVRRAAWNYFSYRDFLQVVRACNAAVKLGEDKAVRRSTATLVAMEPRLRQYPPDMNRENIAAARRGELVGDFAQICSGEQTRRRSKRVGLGELPTGWREALVEFAKKSGSKHTLAIAALALTGCRTEEVARGVEAWRQDGELHVRIRGAKFVEGRSGQEWRELVFPDATACPGGAEVAAAVSLACGEKIKIKVDSKHGLQNYIREVGPKVAKGADYGISSLSLRHAFASDLKAEKYKRSEIAAALGHAVDRTCSTYGSHVHGRGTVQVRVTISGTVKQTSRDPTPHLKGGDQIAQGRAGG